LGLAALLLEEAQQASVQALVQKAEQEQREEL
jgi:hypothetical protein